MNEELSGTQPSTRQERLAVPFDLDSLYQLRSSVAAHAAPLGVHGERLSRLLVVATELATNAVRHGTGEGVLHLWAENGSVYCQVIDGGPGIADPHLAGTDPVQIGRDGGRGLWLVRVHRPPGDQQRPAGHDRHRPIRPRRSARPDQAGVVGGRQRRARE